MASAYNTFRDCISSIPPYGPANLVSHDQFLEEVTSHRNILKDCAERFFDLESTQADYQVAARNDFREARNRLNDYISGMHNIQEAASLELKFAGEMVLPDEPKNPKEEALRLGVAFGGAVGMGIGLWAVTGSTWAAILIPIAIGAVGGALVGAGIAAGIYYLATN